MSLLNLVVDPPPSFQRHINVAQFLAWAKQDIKGGSRRDAINALSNVKRALHARIDEVLWALRVQHSADWPDRPPQLKTEIHPVAIIATQSCDLDWDFRRRQEKEGPEHKLVPNILFIEMRPKGLKSELGINYDTYRRIESQRDQRYHLLKPVDAQSDAKGEGLEELICDFKRIFAVPTDEVYWQIKQDTLQRRCRLTNPYLQHFAHRFYGFHSRVAIPDEG